MTKVQEALEGVHRLGIDTSPLIYLVERHPEFSPVVREVIQRAEAGEIELATSTLTLTEVLTLPFQQQAESIAETYRAILLGSPYTRIYTVDSEIAQQAARLRAAYRLKTPDAIQLAVALQAGCEAFLTNDKNLRRVQDLRILVLLDLAAS